MVGCVVVVVVVVGVVVVAGCVASGMREQQQQLEVDDGDKWLRLLMQTVNGDERNAQGLHGHETVGDTSETEDDDGDTQRRLTMTWAGPGPDSERGSALAQAWLGV